MSILECKGLSKRFGAVTALDGISFTIEPGRIVGLPSTALCGAVF